MNFTQRLINHTKTVARHRREVRKLMKQCGLRGGWLHDLSKYSPVEFWNGVKYYTGTASLNIVIKLQYVNGHPVAKLSDDWGKSMCQDDGYLEYLKGAVNYRLTEGI